MPRKLQDLRLHMCNLSRSTLLQLAQLSGVAKLELGESPNNPDGPFSQPEAVKHLLQGMSNLKWLRLEGTADAANIMPVLPAHSLAALILYQHGDLMKLPDSTPRLVNLRELKLTTGLNPVALASITMLTKLQLKCCKTAAGVDDNTSGFLATVRGMCQLQHLEVLDSCEALLQAAEPRACAALTASSQLTCLEITNVGTGQAQSLPATALQQMFPAGKQLPQMQHLVICLKWGDDADAGRITTSELSSLVDVCPALTCLDLTCVLAPDADVSALLKLPQQCQHLAIGGQAFGDEAAGVVAQLTQLTRLNWTGYPGLTYAGLVQLTALHALDTLHIQVVTSQYVCDSVSLKTKAGAQVRSKKLRWHCCRQRAVQCGSAATARILCAANLA